MDTTVSKEDYLKAIAEAETDGEPVIAATLVRWLKVTPAAVTMALRRLRRDGLAVIRKDGRLQLTAKGRYIADLIRFRHHLIERMLTEMFSMEWYKVHEEAERLEHAVSEDFEQRLVAVLGTGKTCPHGNSVRADTQRDRRKRHWMLLDEVQSPGELQLVSVYERDRQMMEFLDRLELRPGVRFSWVCRNYDETVTIQTKGRTVQLGAPVAKRVWVARIACPSD